MFLSALLCAAFLWKHYGKTEAVFSLFAFASCGKLFYYHAARQRRCGRAVHFLLHDRRPLPVRKSPEIFMDLRRLPRILVCLPRKRLARRTIALLVLLTLLFTGRFSQMRLKHYALCALSSLGPAGLWALAAGGKTASRF